MIEFALPAGEHVVQLRWEAFPALVWARWLSLTALILSVVILLVAIVRIRAVRSIPSNA